MSKRDRTYFGDDPQDPALSGERDASPPDSSSASPGGDAASSGPIPTPELKPLATGLAAPGGASADDIKTAAERAGGEPPRAAPKGGEGTNTPLREVAHPELEPPTPPTEFRVAPSGPGDVERESFGSTRPSYEDVKAATVLELQTVDERSAGLHVAGVFVTRTPVEVQVASILGRGENYLKSLAADPRVELRVKE